MYIKGKLNRSTRAPEGDHQQEDGGVIITYIGSQKGEN